MKNLLFVMGTSCMAALCVYGLREGFGLDAITAAACIGLVAVIVTRRNQRFEAVWYTGAFVGMSTQAILPTLPLFIAAGMLSGLYFELSGFLFSGMGGKMGTAAFCAVATIVFLSRFT